MALRIATATDASRSSGFPSRFGVILVLVRL